MDVERDQETVDLFVEETIEGLERSERLLVAAEQGAAPSDMLDTLFRDLHTIKGTSSFLAFERIRSVAHAAEDLLSRLRDKELAPSPHHFGVLLEVVDALRWQIKNVREVGDEDEVDVEPLLARLRECTDRRAQSRLSVAPVPPRGSLFPRRPEVPLPVSLAPPPAPLRVPEISRGDVTIAGSRSAQPDAREVPPPAPQILQVAVADDKQPAADVEGSVRVPVSLLDRLMNLVGELVLTRNQILQLTRSSCEANPVAHAAAQRLSVVTSELQDQMMRARMQPVARVFEKIPRIVRDACQMAGKRVQCDITDNDTEIDKALVEAIRDPVMHIVRNAVDHGIEPPEERVSRGKPEVGRVFVRARHDAGSVCIEIEDDGRGMDPQTMRAHAVRKGLLTEAEAARLDDREAIDLVFRPGFSTAAAVTSLSGRGVGMDVVRTHVERAGGQVEIDTRVGLGSVVRLRMPLTLAIIPTLLVRVGEQRYAIPQSSLQELVYVDEADAASVESVRGAEIYRLRGEILPLVRLGRLLGVPSRPVEGTSIAVVGAGARKYGLVVDEIHDSEEIVLKALHGSLERIRCYAGATVLGDGGVALVLDTGGVAAMAGIDVTARAQARAVLDRKDARSQERAKPFLVFEAGSGQPCAVPLSAVARLETVAPGAIESLGGREVLQYRGAVIPVVRVERALPLGDAAPSPKGQQLVVFELGQTVALAVSAIVDVVELDEPDDGYPGAEPGVLGRAIVLGRATLVLDLSALIGMLAPELLSPRRARALVTAAQPGGEGAPPSALRGAA